MSPKINLRLYKNVGNYVRVEESIFDSVARHFAPEEFSKDKTKRPDAINFSLFIQNSANVLMSHGVADKNYMLRKKDGLLCAHRFGHLFVPGPWLKARWESNAELAFQGKIHSVGWPRLDDLLVRNAAHVRMPSTRPRVLWAPTHDYRRYGEDKVPLSSFPEFEEFLPKLRETCDVEISLHPRNRKNKKPTSDQLIACDFVISDFGTMVYEAWALGKPVIFPYWIIGDRMRKFLPPSAAEHFIYDQRIGMHANSFQELLDFVHGEAVIDDRVAAFRDAYLDPQYHGVSGQRIADLLRELASAI